ncbi:MAG: class I SAM-dependent methyltransferase [Acidobacteria bacterium]|nr:class I SAM-dependent methyltransferase [Acidobacteriota bacterium]
MTYFHRQAAAYAEFRPDYPDELFRYAATLTARHHCAWDCATGNGQAAVCLARTFDRVIATDASAEQLAHARPHPRVEYRLASAEASGLPGGTAELVTVCQALHWFDRPRFFAEARRVLRPEGALIATVYGDAHIVGHAALDDLMQTFNKLTMRDYWPPDRALVNELYAGITFPFELLAAPELEMSRQWTLLQLAGYLRSWSAVSRFSARHGFDPVIEIEKQMENFWGDPLTERKIEWPFRIFAGRVK